MKVTFITNLGSRDAEPLGLDYKVCGEGMSLDVPPATAKELHELGVIKKDDAAPADVSPPAHKTETEHEHHKRR